MATKDAGTWLCSFEMGHVLQETKIDLMVEGGGSSKSPGKPSLRSRSLRKHAGDDVVKSSQDQDDYGITVTVTDLFDHVKQQANEMVKTALWNDSNALSENNEGTDI